MEYKNFWQKILSIKNESSSEWGGWCNKHKILTIFGLKIAFKAKIRPKDIMLLIQAVRNENYIFYRRQKSTIEAAAVHPLIFSKYKNIYQDKTVAIIGCAPSIIHYTPSDDVIHMGVNKSFLLKNINIDYLFMFENDPDDSIMHLANEYRGDKCTKFYSKQPIGLIQDFQNPEPKHYHFHNKNIYQFISQGCWHDYWPLDISYEPFYLASSSIFFPLQFALHTGAKRILIAGCDATNNGHFHEEEENGYLDIPNIIKNWKSFKEYVDKNYPNIEVISINPVGLKGMFKDVYTQSYVDEHPELLNENIEICKGIYK